MRIKYVNAPKKPDGKFGNIKMESGETFFVNIGMLPKYTVGMDITPPFENKKWGESVVQVIPPGFDPSTPATSPAPNHYTPPAPQPQPAPTPPAAQHSAPPRTPDKSGEMFVMGVVGRAMGSGKFETQDIKLLALAAADAWNEVKGKL